MYKSKMSVDLSSKRICVIGAGPSGLSVLRAFKSAQEKGEKIPQIVCYDKQAEIGGLWNYTWRTGLNEHGDALPNSMYRYLWSNAPKEILEFADYSFEEHFGQPIPSFPPREVLLDYIKGRANKSGVQKWIKLNTTVRRVSYNRATKTFTVSSSCQGINIAEVFNYVIVSTGHFSVPNVPEWPGFDKFEGRILHAHDFRDATEFAGKDILVIGASLSVEDIALQCYKFGVKSITMSWRTRPLPFNWPDCFTTVPLLDHVEGSTCFFKNGSSKNVDTIILCTGYQHYFPFMEESITLRTQNSLWPNQLLKGIFLPTNPRVMYMGMQDQLLSFSMFDAQAWYLRDCILGKIRLPVIAEMKLEFSRWQTRASGCKTIEEKIQFQADYVADLVKDTDYPMYDVQKTVDYYLKWRKHKLDNILTYRDHTFRSILTGTMSPIHHTPWLKAMDDSMECFLKKN